MDRTATDWRAAFSYDGRVFRASDEPAASAAEQASPVAHYHQDGQFVWGEFAGGGVQRGTLSGTTDAEGGLDFGYCMVLTDGTAVVGRCHSVPEPLGDGRIRLFERWERYWPDPGTGTSYLTEL